MDVFLFDDLPPEDLAMLQALYSRSPASVVEHLARVRAKGSGAFMEKYYVGYGHDSIAECGTTTLFLEGLSLLAALLVQDNPLYRGQEASTRYIDFQTQPLLSLLPTPSSVPSASASAPVPPIATSAAASASLEISKTTSADPSEVNAGTSASLGLQKRWMSLYHRLREELPGGVEEAFPCPEETGRGTWQRAIHAFVCDISRGWLPLGITTSLSWTADLRQLNVQIGRMASSSLAEIRALAQAIHRAVAAKYPHTIKPLPSVETLSPWFEEMPWFEESHESLEIPPSLAVMINDRKRGDALPRAFESLGSIRLSCPLDLGAFRDLHRHRRMYCPIPPLPSAPSLDPWYVAMLERFFPPASLPSFLRDTRALLSEVVALASSDTRFYALPLGVEICAKILLDIPQATYLFELRSSPSVHPILRRAIHKLALDFQRIVPSFPSLRLHPPFPDLPFLPRGQQTIQAKTPE